MTSWHRRRWAPWAALLAAALGMALHQQGLADLLRFECTLGTAKTGTLSGLFVLALMLAGCWISWRSLGSVDGVSGAATRRFIVHLGLLFAALMAVAVLWQVLATYIVPPCPH